MWGCPGLADIRVRRGAPERMPHHGDHGEEEAPASPSFTPEYKAGIVDACRRGDRSIGQAHDFDLTETAVRAWVKQADVDAGGREGMTSQEWRHRADCSSRTRRDHALPLRH